MMSLKADSLADLTKTIIHGGLHIIDSGVSKATDLAKSSLQFVKRSVNTSADFAISALDTAKTKTSGTIKVRVMKTFNCESILILVVKKKFNFFCSNLGSATLPCFSSPGIAAPTNDKSKRFNDISARLSRAKSTQWQTEPNTNSTLHQKKRKAML